MKTLIWDYNGTILNDVGMSVKLENMMMARRHMNKTITMEEYRELFCFPIIDYYKKVGYTFENETYEDISVEYNALYDQMFDECTLADGFTELIQLSLKKGYQNVILSACEHNKLNAQCRQLGIDQYFREILGIDNILGGSKVDMAKHWMIRSGVNPDDCMYLGDTEHDLDTAQAIGITNCFLVANGHQAYDVLKKRTQHVVHSLREITLL